MGKCPLIGILNGSTKRARTLEYGSRFMNTLQEAAYNSPYKPIIAMGALNASQLAYRMPMAPAGADSSINYFFWLQLHHFLSYEASWGFLLHKRGMPLLILG